MKNIAMGVCMISVAACGGHQHAAKTDIGQFTLVVGGELTTSRGHEPVVSATVLHAGDRMTLAVHATQPVELFVAYCDSKAKQQVYGPLTTLANGDVHIPEHGSFRVDDNVGLEHVFVIASSKPLASSDPKLDQILHAASGEQPCSERLAMTTEASRGLEEPEATATNGSAETTPAPHIEAAATEPKPPVATHYVAGGGARATFPRVPKRWRARGFEVEDDSGSTSSTLSDTSGIAIWAITLKHE